MTDVPRHDLRAVPAAVAVWLATLLGLLLAWELTLAVAAATVLLSAAALRARRLGRWRTAAGAGLVCGGLLLATVCPRLAGAQHDPARRPAEAGAVAELRVTLTERPRPVRSSGYAGRPSGARALVVRADLIRLRAEGADVGSTGRVILLTPVDGWAGLRPGQEVTAAGRLAPARQGELTVATLSARGPPAEAGPVPWAQALVEPLRAGLLAASATLGDEPAGLLPGLVVGDTSGLSARIVDEFRDSGLSHLTAASGTNVMIVAGAVLLLMRRVLRLGPRSSAAAAGLTLAGYVVLVGPEPSVLRAAVMGAVGLLALGLGRDGSAVPALALAVAGLVLWDPAMAADVGFALSVVATAGLVLVAPRCAAALAGRGVPVGLAEALAVPVVAFLVTAPVLAGVSGELSMVAVVANLLAAPVVAPATVLGVLATVLSVVSPGAASAAAHVAEPALDWLILVAREGAALPGAVLGWPSGWWGGVLAAAAVGAIVAAVRIRRLRVGLAVLLVVLLLVVVPVRMVAPAWPPAGWSVAVCDVGQGDALALATAEPGRAVVVDAGPEPGPVDRCLDRLGVDRVPLLVLSHLHADHVGGLSSVFEGRTVGAVAVGPGRSPGWAWREVGEQAARHGVPLVDLAAGLRLEWPGLGLEVLGPRYAGPEGEGERDGTAINNSSVVLRATTPAGRLLLTGDVELAAQADLLASGADLRAEILKVPHHGSRATLPRFVEAVAPRLASVSVGAGNTYGHPARSTVDALLAAGALLVRTDLDGDHAVLPGATGPAVVRRGR
ncbi:ComEC/Rec2 family competence protein [Amycolatopsis suaedae]|uniref:ComEC/Rec2 family competence protein n=1 Tax=Amycolatopsis suaedae TaxID=2510978 RepID=A0A4Q7J1Y8_9PSEU|nr:ComEC/Rec2 family competence protein [Amycolatopsis suaedae]RZQ60413.1 ComEC/Rec2 family competence protein [Amycolatopsis suaedae]